MEFNWTVEYSIDFNIDSVFNRIKRNIYREQDMFMVGYSIESVINIVVADILTEYDDDIYYSITEEVKNQISAAVLEKYKISLERIRQQALAKKLND